MKTFFAIIGVLSLILSCTGLLLFVSMMIDMWFGKNLCSSGHDKICFEGRKCPFCLFIKEVDKRRNHEIRIN